MRNTAALSMAFVFAVGSLAGGSEIKTGSIDSELVPGPLVFDVLLPEGYTTDGERYPLVLALSGGGGSKDTLTAKQPICDELWKSGDLPELVVVTPTVRPFCSYIDFQDGSEKWESVILGPLLDHLPEKYHVTRDPQKTFVCGGSMGGAGALQMAMRYPERFGAVAAVGAGVMPALRWKDAKRRNRAFLSEQHWRALHGDPIDEEHWEQYHPATILSKAPERIRDSGLKIYIASGDQDTLLLHDGNEFLHRTLLDHGISHEYHVLHGLPHGGGSAQAFEEPFRFIGRALRSDFAARRQSLYWEVIREKGGIPGLAGTPEENKRFHDEVVEEMRKRWEESSKQTP